LIRWSKIISAILPAHRRNIKLVRAVVFLYVLWKIAQIRKAEAAHLERIAAEQAKRLASKARKREASATATNEASA
jgi:hypothetical protein